MHRKLFLAVLTAAAFSLPLASAATAGPISPNNPYRSFNLTGVNYGSMRWEQSNRQGRVRAANTSSWRLFRRR